MTVEFKGNDLVITIKGAKKKNLKGYSLSKSGKSYTIASSGGFKETELEIDGKNVHVNVNALAYVKDKKEVEDDE